MPDYQSRKYQITINNPLEHGMTHDYIQEILASLSLRYWCLADEKGTQGTYHTHIYLASSKGAIRFSTLQRKFLSIAHIENARGSDTENRDYIVKQGKHADKALTSIPGTFVEWGELQDFDDERSRELNRIKEEIINGATTGEILESNPQHLFRATRLDEARNALLADDFSCKIRDVEVSYYFGTLDDIASVIYSKYNAKDIYRWTYSNTPVCFDGYSFHSIILFHGYNAEIPHNYMVSSILSGFPLQLHCRFRNVQAAYNQVIISSSVPPDHLYASTEYGTSQQILEFIEKLNHIYHVHPDLSFEEVTINFKEEHNE